MTCIFRPRRLLITLLLIPGFWIALTARAEVDTTRYRLPDARQVGDRQKVTVVMQLTGQLAVPAPSGSAEAVGLSAQSKLVYHECLHQARPAAPVAGRHYTSAQASIQIGQSKHEVVLGQEQKWVLAATKEAADGPPLSAVKQPLSRDELEMLNVLGNSLHVYELLPDHAVQTGETWEPSPSSLAKLLNLDEVTVNQTKARFVAVARGLARMQVGGTILGNVDGVATEIAIEGELRFDLQWKRISWLQLVVHEQREASPIQAGFTIKAEVRMLCEPLTESPLTAETTRKMAALCDNREPQLRYVAPQNGCRLVHPPAWHVFEEDATQTSLRLVLAGKLIAQCNVQRLADGVSGSPLSMDEFQADIRSALKEGFVAFDSSDENERKDGYRVLRVAVTGTAADLPIRWIYYHISNEAGAAASCVFTMESEAATHFEGYDRLIVAGLQLGPRETNRPSSEADKPADSAQAAGAATDEVTR